MLMVLEPHSDSTGLPLTQPTRSYTGVEETQVCCCCFIASRD